MSVSGSSVSESELVKNALVLLLDELGDSAVGEVGLLGCHIPSKLIKLFLFVSCKFVFLAVLIAFALSLLRDTL